MFQHWRIGNMLQRIVGLVLLINCTLPTSLLYVFFGRYRVMRFVYVIIVCLPILLNASAMENQSSSSLQFVFSIWFFTSGFYMFSARFSMFAFILRKCVLYLIHLTSNKKSLSIDSFDSTNFTTLLVHYSVNWSLSSKFTDHENYRLH